MIYRLNLFVLADKQKLNPDAYLDLWGAVKEEPLWDTAVPRTLQDVTWVRDEGSAGLRGVQHVVVS